MFALSLKELQQNQHKLQWKKNVKLKLIENNKLLSYDFLHKTKCNLYNKTRQFVYMFPIIGQTSGPNGLKFFERT